MDERTIIIGAGQAGLATAYHLTRRGLPCVALDAHDRVGDSWRERYDSLRLFTPARSDSLPGLSFPAPGWSFPTAGQMADYLERYAAELHLPVRTGVSVQRVRGASGDFRVETSDGELSCSTLVVAAGGHRDAWTPALATAIDPTVVQLHSTDYRRPGQLPDGPVLVVGASHSGADLALELARAGHDVVLAGRVHGELPYGGVRGRISALLLPTVASHVLTVRTPVGRRMQPVVRAGGAPLLRVKQADLAAAGVRHLEARVVEVREGRPVLDDGTVVEARSIVWATGFRDDFRWVEPAPLGEDGYPVTDRGIVPSVPGLYFVGLPFQYAFSSAMVHGVGRDAEHVARHLATTAAGRRPATAAA
ncbi:flavin-containing monooxygenase [Cellulomonas sp. P5_C6]